MHDNNRSLFEPDWYKNAFDRFDSIANELDRQEKEIRDGYVIPDQDGARSSADYKRAMTTNSFQERALKESLSHIYGHSSHTMRASNHDTNGFYQWIGNLSDFKFISNTDRCELTLPVGNIIIISPTNRDAFKHSQFYRKWVKIQDILNHWDLFQFAILIFINQRIYSEWEMRIDDQQITFRMPYHEYWRVHNFPVYLYKIPTRAQCRVKISQELCVNQWDWKMPVSYIADQRICNSKNLILAINRIADPTIRRDGRNRIEVLGDNLEFLPIENGYVDLSQISLFNKNYIKSEFSDWIWLSFIVPYGFHEYPIPITVDSIYKSYKPKLQAVVTKDLNDVKHVKTMHDGAQHQIFVDIRNEMLKEHNGWDKIIRPIVLSEASATSYTSDTHSALIAALRKLKDVTIAAADADEAFRFYIKKTKILDHAKLEQDIDNLHEKYQHVYDAYRDALKHRGMEEFDSYEEIFHSIFPTAIDDVKKKEMLSKWVTPDRNWHDNFWKVTSRLITIPREFADRYISFEIISQMKRVNFMEPAPEDRIRFQRPIDASDFWIFEYDSSNFVYRPNPMRISHHFPDVYLLHNDGITELDSRRIFKAFFFYSDAMNVRDETIQRTIPTQTWDKDMEEYYFSHRASYRDIFLEKFYWMGMHSIYRGILLTQSKWELIEYIANNPSYERFNQLFLHTMDPYFKYGLATYLNSPDASFPFDHLIHKLKESEKLKHLGYDKVGNFELYLNYSWMPSYFDFVTKVIDGWDPGTRLIRRPPSTFDVRRLIPQLKKTQTIISVATKNVLEELEWVKTYLEEESYRLDVHLVQRLYDIIRTMSSHISSILTFLENIDEDIFSLADVNHIIAELESYFIVQQKVMSYIDDVRKNVEEHSVYDHKNELIGQLRQSFYQTLSQLKAFIASAAGFDIESFITSVNDIRTYFHHNKENPDDISLMGQINRFNDPWTEQIKSMRNEIFVAVVKINEFSNPKKSYTSEDIIAFLHASETLRDTIVGIRPVIQSFWKKNDLTVDQDLIDRLDHVEDQINRFLTILKKYHADRNLLFLRITETIHILNAMETHPYTKNEREFSNAFKTHLTSVLSLMSYMIGYNRTNDALNAMNDARDTIDRWLTALQLERGLFEMLQKIVKEPSDFLATIMAGDQTLHGYVSYMREANLPFVPDMELPTYADVYEADEIEITNNGLQYAVDEDVIVPNLGSYHITKVNAATSAVEEIARNSFYQKTFRDPMIQERPYDSTSTIQGVGLMIRAKSSIRTKIINDAVASTYVKRIQNIITNIRAFLNIPNAYNNDEYRMILHKIDDVTSEWNHVIDVYGDYVSDTTKKRMRSLIHDFESLLDPSKKFMENRDYMNPVPFFRRFEKLIGDISSYVEEHDLACENFHFYDTEIRKAYAALHTFIGVGTGWSDLIELKKLLFSCRGTLKAYYTSFIVPNNLTQWEEVIQECQRNITEIVHAIDLFAGTKRPVQTVCDFIDDDIKTTLNQMQIDKWYRIRSVASAECGKGYLVGDIVSVKKDDIILLFQITRTDHDGAVLELKPLMDYALPNHFWGIYPCTTIVGSGSGLTIDIFSYQVALSDIRLLQDPKNYIPPAQFYNNTDLILFSFENIHDLNIQYEVFLGGRQIRNFHHRHKGNHDLIYVNANDVMRLQTSHIHIPGENYFIYKINDVVIRDPGAGYALGQDIVVENDHVPITLRIDSLLPGPYKGIDTVSMHRPSEIHGDVNPSVQNALVAPDNFSNIDDEYTLTPEDLLPRNGVERKVSRKYNVKYRRKRLDSLDSDNRNDNYMYRDVENKTNQQGDPDFHWYQGSRIDNSQHPMHDHRRWNGIMNLIPPTDPFIPDDRRIPPNLPVKGEYQKIKRVHLHSEEEIEFMVRSNRKDHIRIGKDGGNVVINYAFKHVRLNGNHFTKSKNGITLNFAYLLANAAEIEAIFHNNTPVAEKEEWKELDIDIANVKFDDRCFVKDERGHIFLNISYLMANHSEIVRLFNKDIIRQFHELTIDETPLSVMKMQFSGAHFKLKDELISLDFEKLFGERTHIDFHTSVSTLPSSGGSVRMDVTIHGAYAIPWLQGATPTEMLSDNLHLYRDGGSVDVLLTFKKNKELDIHADLTVPYYSDLPMHIKEWPEGRVGKVVRVTKDENNFNHTTLYRIRTFISSGYFVYDDPEYADSRWNTISVDWERDDYRPDFPDLHAQYPSEDVPVLKFNADHFIQTDNGIELNLSYLMATLPDIEFIFGKMDRLYKKPTNGTFLYHVDIRYHSNHFLQQKNKLSLNLKNIMAQNAEIGNLFDNTSVIVRDVYFHRISYIKELNQDHFIIRNNIISLNLARLMYKAQHLNPNSNRLDPRKKQWVDLPFDTPLVLHQFQNTTRAPWRDDKKTYSYIKGEIDDGKYINEHPPQIVHQGTYIHNITVDDISVFNWTLKRWENLHNTKRWVLQKFYPIRVDEIPNLKLNADHFIQTPNGIELNFDYLLATVRDIHSIFGKMDRLLRYPSNGTIAYVREETKFHSNCFLLDGKLLSLNLPNLLAFATEIENLFHKVHKIKRNNVFEQLVHIQEFDANYFVIENDIVSLNLSNLLYYTKPIRKEIRYGFRLIFAEKGYYSYDMILYLNKIPSTQNRNATLVRPARMDIFAGVVGEVHRPPITYHVNTGNSLLVRKLFPYHQKETFSIGTRNGQSNYEMNFKLAPYMHFHPQILLQDVKIYNVRAKRFENLLDPKMFEVRFKDNRSVQRGFETQTNIESCILSDRGEDFHDGTVWGWNAEYKVHLFGIVQTEHGAVTSFQITHCPNPITSSMMLSFDLYQNTNQSESQCATVLVAFKTERIEVFGDGYIHNVCNPFAPIPDEFKIIAQYNLDDVYDYEVHIDLRPAAEMFIRDRWMSHPMIRIPRKCIPNNRLYVLTPRGRLPIINPSTGKPTLVSREDEYGTNVIFMNIYRRYEKIEIRALPYAIRSVYTQRKIPSHGYINLFGKINKPLNRNYFEFWVNGKLLSDEVTIITPTKIFLHGLTSLKNLEIVEIHRDPNEYFSDGYLGTSETNGRDHVEWNHRTYLDDALEGNLQGDNYELSEQEALLSPVWKQVAENHPEFKNYPPNTDVDDDILQRTYPGDDIQIAEGSSSFDFMFINTPTLEGIRLTGRSMRWEHFGLTPITDQMIVDMLNEEWKEEIQTNPYFHEHNIITDDMWYGIVARMFTERGVYTTDVKQSAYQIHDDSLLQINTKTKRSKIIPRKKTYDLD